MGSLLREKREKVLKFNDGLFEMLKTIRKKHYCNNSNFQKILFDKLTESGNENLKTIIKSIVKL